MPSKTKAQLLLRRLAIAIFALSANIAIAQQPRQFEAAAIKPGNPQMPGMSSTSFGGPGGTFRLSNTPLKQWIMLGLSVRDYALKAPAWLDSARFDLEAKLPNTPLDQNARPEMMKSLLIKRFDLKWHEEPQTVAGFELVPDKKILLQPSGILDRLHGPGSSGGNGLISGNDLPISELAKALGDALQKPVVDSTHLTGVYTYKLMWQPSDEATLATRRQYDKQYGTDVDNLPSSLTTALREQLGLRLQPAKVPAKIIVIDNINRQPTAN